VSGGAGVIGTELVEKLLTQGAQVWVGDLKPQPTSWTGRLFYREGDLNYVRYEEVAAFRPEIFVHLAATFERSVETPEFWGENFQHNVRLSNHLCTLLQRVGSLRTIVFASSYLLYDSRQYLFSEPQTEARRLREDAPVSPRNLCGAAKQYHELELEFLRSSLPKVSMANARIFRGFGRGSRDVISRWTRDLLLDREITVFRSEGMFDFTYAEDTAEALLRLAVARAEGVVNVGTGRARRVAEVVEVLGREFPNMRIIDAASDIRFEASEADIERLRAITGWVPEHTLETAIARIVEYEARRAPRGGAQGPIGGAAAVRRSLSTTDAALVTSVSRKVALVGAVRRALRKAGSAGPVHGGDVDSRCVAAHFVDRFWTTPRLDALAPGDFADYCLRNSIRFVFPSRDGELRWFAGYRDEFAKSGIHVMVSSAVAIDACLDKLKFAERLRGEGFPTIPTLNAPDPEVADRWVVKERFGSGSRDVHLDVNEESARRAALSMKSSVFQPFVAGREYSVDVYFAGTGRCHGAVARTRDLVVGGESQVTTSVRHASAERLCAAVGERLGLRGHTVFQLIESRDGALHLIECNPRFGGASSLAVACGLDSLYWFVLEAVGAGLDGQPFLRSEAELRQIRYPADVVGPADSFESIRGLGA